MRLLVSFLIIAAGIVLSTCAAPATDVPVSEITTEDTLADAIPVCSCAEQAIINLTLKGDFYPALSYLENEGGVFLECRDRDNNETIHMLGRYVVFSDSLRVIAEWLDHDYEGFFAAEGLRDAMIESDKDRMQFFLDQGAQCALGRLYYDCRMYVLDVKPYQMLAEMGYDFNYQHWHGRQTLLMELASCNCNEEPGNAQKIIEIMKFLIESGARTNIEDENGNTLKDVAINPEIAAFVENLQQ